MPTEIDQVLSCKNLPSLPGVAVEVLELTRNPNVRLEEIAKLIQNDTALTAKVLRTVNSSYYGLTQRCSTLGRALGYLGLKTVKSLVLGFCLVDSTRDIEAGGFDLADYWRRAIYSATAARQLAASTGACDADEAFTACLFQDIGMLACFASMGKAYSKMLEKAPKDHGLMLGFEQEALGFTHPEVGAQLAEKWNLPPQLIACIRHHHNVDGAESDQLSLVRIVALANVAAGAMAPDAPSQAMANLLMAGAEWFGKTPDEIRALLDKVVEGARELAEQFDKDPGATPDIGRLMSEANDQLLEFRMESEKEVDGLRKSTEALARQASTDALTGVFNRQHFDEQLPTLFAQSAASGTPLAVLFIDADKFKSVNDSLGHQCGDLVLKELASRFRTLLPQTALVCRYGGEEFAVILPGTTLDEAVAQAEVVRSGIASPSFDLSSAGGPSDRAITVSLGVSCLDAGTRSKYTTPMLLVKAADEAVYLAKKNGRNRVEASGAALTETAKQAQPEPLPVAPVVSHNESPEVKPIPSVVPANSLPPAAATNRAVSPVSSGIGSGLIDILVVEDDPLSSRLLVTLLSKRDGARVTAVRTGEEGLARISQAPAPSLVLTDLHLPGMSGLHLLGAARAIPATRNLPMIVLTSSRSESEIEACRAAGASAVLSKELIVTDLNGAMAQILGCVRAKAA